MRQLPTTPWGRALLRVQYVERVLLLFGSMHAAMGAVKWYSFSSGWDEHLQSVQREALLVLPGLPAITLPFVLGVLALAAGPVFMVGSGLWIWRVRTTAPQRSERALVVGAAAGMAGIALERRPFACAGRAHMAAATQSLP